MKYKIALIMTALALMLTGCSKTETEISETAAEETTAAETSVTAEETEKTSETASSVSENRDGIDVVDYILDGADRKMSEAQAVFDQLTAAGTIGEEVYMLSWSAESVSDGLHSTKDGLVENWHIEGLLDISLPFTDILNQKDEQEQIDTMTAISKAYKDALGVDVVRITCNGESIITDQISYDEIVREEIDKFSQIEDVEAEECYEEEE